MKKWEGCIFRGRDPHVASVAFNPNMDPAKGQVVVDTDDNGRYELVLFRPGTYVAEVELGGAPGAPMREIVQIEDLASVEYDFVRSSVRFVVEIVDATSGEAVVGVQVSVSNESDGGHSAQLVETDSEGLLELVNLRTGLLGLSAHFPWTEPVEVGLYE